MSTEKHPSFLKSYLHRPSSAPKVDPEVVPFNAEPEYVYGCSKKGLKGSFLLINNEGNLVYPSAACGVTLNVAANTQKIFRKHDDDVICIALHPDGRTVATGQIGKNDFVYVYDSETMDLLASLKTHTVFTEGGVLAVSFSADGHKLAVLGGKQENSTLMIFDWKNQEVIAKGKGGNVPIYSMLYAEDDSIYICGQKSLKRAVLQKKNIDSHTVAIGGVTANCIVRAESGKVIVGTADGNLLILQGQSVLSKTAIHTGSVYCIARTTDGFVTGGKDSKINVLDSKLKVTKSISTVSAVRGIAVSPVDKKTFACLDNGDFIQIDLASGSISTILKGHSGQHELWALCCVPNSTRFVSAGDDGRIIVWDYKTRKHVNEVAIKGHKVRSVAVSPDATLLACGTKEATVHIFNIKDIVAQGKSAVAVKQFQSGNEEIAVMKFSPSGKTLAVGSHDNNVRLYSVAKNFELKNKGLVGHTSFITALDWSEDTNFIQTTCGAYELLYWNAKDGSRMLDGSAMKDVKWATQTCKLGWSVRGIWLPSKYNDGSDINAVDVDFKLSLTAVADDKGLVCLFPFPTATTMPPHYDIIGHCSHVTNVQFTPDHEYVLSAGGADLTIFQHKIRKN